MFVRLCEGGGGGVSLVFGLRCLVWGGEVRREGIGWDGMGGGLMDWVETEYGCARVESMYQGKEQGS